MKKNGDFFMFFFFSIPTIVLIIFLGSDTNKTKVLGKTENAQIEQYLNRLHFATDKNSIKVVMDNGYACKITDNNKITQEYFFTTNKDGFRCKHPIGMSSISIDITNPKNSISIKKILGHKATSSVELYSFKRKCLRELIKFNLEKREQEQ